jgi:hypothetical protein
MNRDGRIVSDVKKLIGLLSSHCEDRATLDALYAMVTERSSWSKAHSLFDKIRQKTLHAERNADPRLLTQYNFEEICAKTLFNLSMSQAPFDADSPYWIIPRALAFARHVGISDSQILACVSV